LYLTVHQCDPDGSGTANLNLIPKREKICYTLTVKQHRSCYRCAHTPHKIKMIKNNPSGYYVNVHNADFPNGAVRGQLHN
jgi:hypothetical protein